VTPRATGIEVIPVPVTPRTTWVFVRLSTNVGISGVGEASFRLLRRRGSSLTEVPELTAFFRLVEESLSIQAYRRRGWPLVVRQGAVAATAFSAVEQALWDIHGKLAGAPVHELLGGRVRDAVALYANVNRMTTDRSPAAFAESAGLAREAGFRAVKAAPFDGFPTADDGTDAIETATTRGVEAMFAIREAVGDGVAVKADCHSHFDFDRAVAVAERLVPVGLDWYEEPLPIADVDGHRALRNVVGHRLAGCETLVGVAGFQTPIATGAFDVLMPDVMLCGGMLEMLDIARSAAEAGIAVSPHNPCGPVATAASLAVCAVADNVESLELQWGEVDWRSSLVDPPEWIEDGVLNVGDAPGLGIELRIDGHGGLGSR